MQRHARRPIGAVDGKPPREPRHQREEQRGHPCAGEEFVDQRIERRDLLAIGDVLQVAVSEEQQTDGGEIAEDRQAGYGDAGSQNKL